jgi:hypothetical protein
MEYFAQRFKYKRATDWIRGDPGGHGFGQAAMKEMAKLGGPFKKFADRFILTSLDEHALGRYEGMLTQVRGMLQEGRISDKDAERAMTVLGDPSRTTPDLLRSKLQTLLTYFSARQWRNIYQAGATIGNFDAVARTFGNRVPQKIVFVFPHAARKPPFRVSVDEINRLRNDADISLDRGYVRDDDLTDETNWKWHDHYLINRDISDTPDSIYDVFNQADQSLTDAARQAQQKNKKASSEAATARALGEARVVKREQERLRLISEGAEPES